MYLINALTLKLERFDDEAHLPPYAILSHTWSGSEITFERYCALHRSPNVGTYSISTQEGLGYLKIRMACVQAVQDGLDYAWVDTCCIDKRSSAELSEAINSMFRWYQKSAICYAYLDDVGAAPQTEELDESLWNKGLLASSERQLAQSRWFTRGWTLQELIAPSQVHLYGRGWTYLGSKHSLRQLLVDITGIDQTALLNANLGRVSVAQRMSWAANRVTTRIEDLAYSLLGIFDVNMPLLYGEGKKAFVRLQEEILKNSADQSLFAWSPTPTNSPPRVLRD
ncbi:heterokaryon incompatibility protein-domain-containing protein [Boeremia exigua]|uniref:heterokaryon incompatibility protein-domain-containing protein n=1 Tax=Boeremia exigua TaxID=749465 RepID=UPI001E8CE889|nr:heterokaryon incompatibility protein-domain-containing protein [Boeremia exigua]KAH6616722.1 heterokaryon incompatibility protein-domain-containing protein [Boeremia exigua]